MATAPPPTADARRSAGRSRVRRFPFALATAPGTGAGAGSSPSCGPARPGRPQPAAGPSASAARYGRAAIAVAQERDRRRSQLSVSGDVALAADARPSTMRHSAAYKSKFVQHLTMIMTLMVMLAVRRAVAAVHLRAPAVDLLLLRDDSRIRGSRWQSAQLRRCIRQMIAARQLAGKQEVANQSVCHLCCMNERAAPRTSALVNGNDEWRQWSV